MTIKIAIIQSHPIQHFCPQFESYSLLPGIHVHVIFNNDKGIKPYFDEQFNREIQWEGINLTGFEHSFLNGKEVSQELESINPDAVMIYGYQKTIQRKAYKWAKKNKKKLLYVSDTENHQKRSIFKRIFKKWILHSYFSSIDCFLSVGDANEDFYKSCGVNNMKIIRMFFPINIRSIDQKLTLHSEYRETLKQKYGISKDTIVVINIGKLVQKKSQQDIISLVQELEKRNVSCTAFLIGSGPDLDKLQKKASTLKTNRVIFKGFLQPEEIVKYLCLSDVYIHPAMVEPHSLAISEAIYIGNPVILSDRCGSYGSTDDVQPGRNGFVYKTGNIKELADKVEILHKNMDLRKTFSENSVRIAHANQKLSHGEAIIAATNMIIC